MTAKAYMGNYNTPFNQNTLSGRWKIIKQEDFHSRWKYGRVGVMYIEVVKSKTEEHKTRHAGGWRTTKKSTTKSTEWLHEDEILFGDEALHDPKS